MKKFTATIDVGHDDVHYVEVPFHPKDEWQLEPVKIPRPKDPRGGKGWLVSGTIEGVKFEGHIGHRYGRTYLILDETLRKLAGVSAGDNVTIAVKPLAAATEATSKPARPKVRRAKTKASARR
jgi:hypothetical protein